jgi:uncharacterized membrane protein YhaH (DUF805 family)
MWKLAQEALRTVEFCGKIQLSWGRRYMDWIITPFQRALDFKGRSRRKEYWLFFLFYVIVSLSVFAVFAAIGGISFDTFDLTPLGVTLVLPVAGIWFIIFVLPMLALSVRRWHDLGYSGWMFVLFVVLGAIPLVGFFANIGNIIWFCFPGTAGPNKYGDDPLDAPYQGYIH